MFAEHLLLVIMLLSKVRRREHNQSYLFTITLSSQFKWKRICDSVTLDLGMEWEIVPSLKVELFSRNKNIQLVKIGKSSNFVIYQKFCH